MMPPIHAHSKAPAENRGKGRSVEGEVGQPKLHGVKTTADHLASDADVKQRMRSKL